MATGTYSEKSNRPPEKKLSFRIKGLFENWGLKFLSLVLALALWLFVTSYQNPETVLTLTDIPVKILHTEILEQEGKVCTVLDGTDVIPVVTINAPRSVADSLTADNVVAVADIVDMQEDGTVPIKLSTNRDADSVTSISGTINEVKLKVENLARATVPINFAVVGEVAEDYQIGETRLDQNQVVIKGPESEVMKVATAGVVVDVSKATSTINISAEIHLYDEDGMDLETDKNISLSVDQVMTRVEILYTKEVPIKTAITGTPAAGYRLSGDVEVEPGTVRIAAKKATADTVDEIVIPAGELDVAGRKTNLVKSLDITKYLPTGVELAEGVDNNVKVTIEIVPAEEITADTSTTEEQ